MSKVSLSEVKRRVALIDADTVIFATAASAEWRAKGQDDDGSDLWLQRKTDEECYAHVVRRFEEIMVAVDAETAIICLSDRDNFRYRVLPTYKHNRHGSRRPPMLKTLRDMLQERKPFPVLFVESLEADDVCGISAGALTHGDQETVICSPDKDLRTIPGLLYACRLDSKVERITEEEADEFHLYQALIGDTTDCYTGCPKVGPVKAKAILEECKGMTPAARWARIVEEFQQRGFDAEYALTQARVARILRFEDWNADTKEVRLWDPPLELAQLGEVA